MTAVSVSGSTFDAWNDVTVCMPALVHRTPVSHKKAVKNGEGWHNRRRPMTKRPLRDATVLLGGIAGIASAATLLRLAGGVSPTTVALTLLLVVLATATFGRLWIATTVALVATLTFNFFFLPPIFTLSIAEVENWIALFTFLIVAVIASKLSATVQARAQEAIARRNEVTRLFDLTRDVLLTTDTRGAIDVLARHVARRFSLPP